MSKINIGRLWYPVKTLGYGQRLGVWVQGCKKRCPGCISPEFQAIDFENYYDPEEILNAIPEGMQPDGLTISGGEPFDQEDGLLELVRLFADRYTRDILIFTGYTLDELHKMNSAAIEEVLKYTAVLIDGEYMESKNEGIGLRGSTNQNIHVFRYEERYQDLTHCKRDIQCVFTDNRLWMIGILPKAR